jgi:hypothetical protein
VYDFPTLYYFPSSRPPSLPHIVDGQTSRHLFLLFIIISLFKEKIRKYFYYYFFSILIAILFILIDNSIYIILPHFFFSSFLFALPLLLPLCSPPYVICSRENGSLASRPRRLTSHRLVIPSIFSGGVSYRSSMGRPACCPSLPGSPTSRVDSPTACSSLWRFAQLCQQMARVVSVRPIPLICRCSFLALGLVILHLHHPICAWCSASLRSALPHQRTRHAYAGASYHSLLSQTRR